MTHTHKKLTAAVTFAVALLLLPLGSAFAALNVELNGVTSTTSTAAVGTSTGGAKFVIAAVWQAPTFSGTSTVLLEEQDSNLSPQTAPWRTVATFTDCLTTGAGTVTVGGVTAAGPCSVKTLTASTRTRLRVTACATCKLYGTFDVVR